MSTAICTVLQENKLSVVLGFITSPLPAYTTFAFKVLGQTNPVSTKPTAPFTPIIAYN